MVVDPTCSDMPSSIGGVGYLVRDKFVGVNAPGVRVVQR